MKTSRGTRAIFTALVATALASAATAAPAGGASGEGGSESATAGSRSADDVVLRRDGSKADPFEAEVGATADSGRKSATVVRRDGSKAVPFVAEVGEAADSPGGGFDWGAAGIGAGIGALLALLGAAGAVAVLSQRATASRKA
ncbi:MAG: hypothetical protein ACRDL1_05175 [Solirubrobacterales bacterium]